MSAFNKTMYACDLDDSEFIDAWTIDKVIDNHIFHEVHSEESLKHHQFKNHDSIKKTFIPVDLAFFRQGVITTVEPETEVDSHKHDEPMLRYVLDGSMKLNGKKYLPGDWVLVPKNTPYEIYTDTGYTNMSIYGNCPCAEICY